MKIIVCIKQVPDTETRIRIDGEGKGIEEGDINWIVSPYDEFAIEEALKIKEAQGGEVVVVSVGPERAQPAIRTGLAMGADSGVHCEDPAFEGLDTSGVAKVLAAAIGTLGTVDLVLMGQQGVGGDNSQVPGMLAELLDMPSVTVAVKLEVQDGKATVEREIEGARETWECSLPAVISAQKGLNEPRYASLKGIMQAKKKPIQKLDAAGLGLAASDLEPKVELVSLELPPPRPDVSMVEGDDPQARSKELLRLLHEEAKVI